MIKKRPHFGALPTLNMPQKSLQAKLPTTRPSRSVAVREESVTQQAKHQAKTSCYKDFPDFCKRVQTLKSISDWSSELQEDRLVFKKMKDGFCLPELQLIVDNSLGFTILVYGWLLPEDHVLYASHLRSMTNVTLSDLVREIQSYSICPGTEQSALDTNIIHHVIPKSVDPLACDENEPPSFPCKEFWRSCKCQLLVESLEKCSSCYEHLSAVKRAMSAKERTSTSKSPHFQDSPREITVNTRV